MGEVVNVLVAVAVIVLVVRWVSSGSKEGAGTPSASTVLGFRPKNVTPEMVETIHSMFPDIPSDNIRFDLLRTGSVQQTSNKILERGFLPPPPAAYYDIYPRALDPTAPAQPAGARPAPSASASTSTASKAKSTNLLARYNLEGRADTSATATAIGTGIGMGMGPEAAGGKAVWEDTAEKREASLRERKAQMILAARQRMLAQQAKEAGSSSSSSS